jgi:DNA-binding transcriptional LysR family regulator
MKIQHLRCFAAVIECGGVVKAAKRLRASQPAISAALKALELELGEALFDRPGGGRRLVPTPKAIRFHRRAADILRQCEAARAEFLTEGDRPPRLRIGALATIASGDIASASASLRRHESRWRLQLWEGDPARIAEWSKQGRIDAAWTLVEADTPNSRVLWREPFVALISRGHRLAQRHRSGIAVKDLDGEPLVLRSACELKSGRLRAAGISIRVAARAARDDLALRLVAQGVGIAIAPRSLATSDVLAIPVTDLGLERSIGLSWRGEIPDAVIAPVLDLFSAMDCVTDKLAR